MPENQINRRCVMNLSPESVKETLLNKVNEMSASSWQYAKKATDFTRNRKISFSDVLLSTISMQKSASKTELLKHFDFNASAPTTSALIQQRKKYLQRHLSPFFTHFPILILMIYLPLGSNPFSLIRKKNGRMITNIFTKSTFLLLWKQQESSLFAGTPINLLISLSWCWNTSML